ncbi:DNA-directed RNA polymerase III subunit RPC3 isoform X2 [Orussus abietinus]|uniref:DNA-directed RNA polymerase III subunit RPC3 isoform X2 n=1 Tax=Orussus abietinus TaxID=222816 RepID=UPI0006253B10|nr:DNA-directed RNA polymerase III subunit RPC3 isoform X2 [Orussus abietinus]
MPVSNNYTRNGRAVMSSMSGKLCSVLLLEHFGQIVQTVGNDLFEHGTKPLSFIRSTTGLPLSKVKEALCVLIKYGIVEFEQLEKSVKYSLVPENILMILRFPRFMFMAKKFCGNEAEMMLEEVLKQGYETGSQIIIKTYQKLLQTSSEQLVQIPQLIEKFELLVKNQFLMRSVGVIIDMEEPSEKTYFSLPDFNLPALQKMVNGNDADPGDSKIYWKVNFDRFTQDLRDQVVISAITKRLDEDAGELMRQLLYLMYLRTASWADTSNPVPCSEIREAVKKLNYPLLTQYLDQYLRVIEDPCHFISRVGDSGGGQYSVNMKEAFEQLAWATLENIVLERFGSKAARIFRLVRMKTYVEQEQIQQLAMIPAKEAKHLTYTLLQENYLQIQELKKTSVSAAPTKTFFLFHIDLNQVVRMEIDHCYQALYNSIQRREHESNVNRRMIDKQLRIQTLTSNLKEHGATEEQLNEIAEMMTPSEKQQLEKVQNVIKRLRGCELQIEETLFILLMHLKYAK